MTIGISDNKWLGLLLAVICLVLWFDPNTFLWRDEWVYLESYYHGRLSLLNGELSSDIKPLYQYLLYAEFRLAGSVFGYYQLINILIHLVTAYFLYRSLLLFNLSSTSCLFGAVFYLFHPTNFVNLMWIFQQCELIHVSLVIGAIFLLASSTNSLSRRSLLLLALILFVQNYFFPNGILYPLLALGFGLMLNKSLRKDRSFQLTMILIFAAHVAYGLIIQQRYSSSYPLPGILDDLPEKLLYFIRLSANSFVRLCWPAYQSGPLLLEGTVLIGVVALLIRLYRSLKDHQHALWWIGIAGFVGSSAMLVLTRYSSSDIHYYYTSLHLPFLTMLLVLLVEKVLTKTKAAVQLAVIVTMGLIFIYGDILGKRIFAERNRKNHMQMESAINQQKNYSPFDDPLLSMRQGGINPDPVILYQFLKKGSH